MNTPESDNDRYHMLNTPKLIIRAYLRASTSEQDSSRAKPELMAFTKAHGMAVTTFYQENVSGTSSNRPELNRLIEEASEGDILLIEKMDRLSRLPWELWQSLKAKIAAKGLIIVIVDQPQTHSALTTTDSNSGFIQRALTAFMLDLAAGMARDDYETRRARQAQGIAKAKAEGKTWGGQNKDAQLHEAIITQLQTMSIRKTAELLGCSVSTVQRVKKQSDIT
ncbi:recombinase family protein [Shewanella sp. DAU305]|uniref:recombinase family protein n=1 Tax=Shewanella TaxID=22 RepID=UPI002283C7B6|nr:recombinase family protein [Shewanella sp. DAU305]WAL77505.1 recombinase family protein [Shewanella sp. DAU305]